LKFVRQGLLCIGLTLGIFFLYYVLFQYIIQHPKMIQESNDSLIQIDSAEKNDKKLLITGWGILLGKDSSGYDFAIALYDRNREKYYFLDMSYGDRKDVDTYFGGEYDYSHCGFQATISLNQLDLDNTYYEVLCYYKSRYRNLFYTNMYITNDGVRYTDPTIEQISADDNEYLQFLLDNGDMLICRPEIGAYLYQYKNDLYWIFDKEYPYWDVNEDSHVSFGMYTTQVELLPENSLNNGWSWGDESFYFRTKELEKYQSSRFRVAMTSLPKYSVRQAWTGYNNGEWMWIQYFHVLLK